MMEQVTATTSTENDAEVNKTANDAVDEHKEGLWSGAKGKLRKPAVGATVAGVAVLAAGALWGVTEAIVAGAAAYAVFRTLKKRSPSHEPERRAA